MEDRLYTKDEVIKIVWESRTFFHQYKDIPFGKIREGFKFFINKIIPQ